MDDKKFKALLVIEEADGSFEKRITERNISDLPKGDILIKVKYAGLNYKDALSASGNKGITRNYPHTPGVDASGIVEESTDSNFQVGDEVIVTGYDLGMNTSGGFAEYISVPSGWVVPLPTGLSLKESMILGTAAFTAALALYKMEMCGQHPEMGEILVSGASGGVGSMAVGILAKAGYRVIASSGKTEEYQWLRNIGAKTCVNREEVNDQSGKALLRSKWAGAIDTVGGNTLATLLKACARGGSVASCGLVGSSELNSTVFPFILNGVNLLGVDSAETPMKRRKDLWNKLAGDWKLSHIDKLGTFVSLDDIPKYMEDILEGETKGRIVAEI